MKIKTFPLHFTEEDLNEIRNAASSQDMTTTEFMLKAIAEKVMQVSCNKR